MSKDMIDYYILFPNHMEGLRLYKILTDAGVKCIIAPAPREASKFCGMSLRITADYLARSEEIIKSAEVITEGIVPVRRTSGTRDNPC